MHPKNPYRTLLSDVFLHYTTHRTGNKCHNTKKTPFLKDVSLSCLECLGGDPETRTMMVFRFPMAPSNQIPHQAVTPGRSILKRRITIAGDGFEPSTFGLKVRRAARLLYPALLPWRLTRAIRDDVLCTSPGVGQSTAGCDTGRPKSHLR